MIIGDLGPHLSSSHGVIAAPWAATLEVFLWGGQRFERMKQPYPKWWFPKKNHPENWGRVPFWLIFFKWVGSTTNQHLSVIQTHLLKEWTHFYFESMNKTHLSGFSPGFYLPSWRFSIFNAKETYTSSFILGLRIRLRVVDSCLAKLRISCLPNLTGSLPQGFYGGVGCHVGKKIGSGKTLVGWIWDDGL